MEPTLFLISPTRISILVLNLINTFSIFYNLFIYLSVYTLNSHFRVASNTFRNYVEINVTHMVSS